MYSYWNIIAIKIPLQLAIAVSFVILSALVVSTKIYIVDGFFSQRRLLYVTVKIHCCLLYLLKDCLWHVAILVTFQQYLQGNVGSVNDFGKYRQKVRSNNLDLGACCQGHCPE